MDLRLYPRPPIDTGLGIHWGSGDLRSADVAKWLPWLQARGIKWVKVLGKGAPDDVLAVRLLVNAGFEVVVRLYELRPHPWFVPEASLVKMYVDAGAHYFEVGNEPNLHAEWQMDAWNRGSQPNQAAEQWLRGSEVVKAAGGIPMLDALSPGGHIHHEVFFTAYLDHMAAVGGSLREILEGCAIATHPRPMNHPLDYAQDTTGWLVYRWYQDEVVKRIGIASTGWSTIPQIATEHGPEVGWDQDNRFPTITRATHADFCHGLITQVSRNVTGNAFFAGCFWLMAGAALGNSTFADAAWIDPPGGPLPIVRDLAGLPPGERVFDWQKAQPGPVPKPAPVPDGIEFVMGFKAFADKLALGGIGPGRPLTHELIAVDANGDHFATYQTTTAGEFRWLKQLGGDWENEMVFYGKDRGPIAVYNGGDLRIA